MNQRGFWRLDGLSDSELQVGLKELLVAGGRTEARIVAHLAEVDARKLHLSLGASSLFDYCLNRLGLSNNEAFHRITAARLAWRFPLIFEVLESRTVHLTAVCLLRDHLTLENHAELLRAVSHKTKIQIEELLARRFPRPDVASHLRKLPSRGIEPLSVESYRLQLNVSSQLKQKIDRARELMSHANPSGELAAVVERAFDVLLERLEAKRFAQTKRPRAEGSSVQGSSVQGSSVQGSPVQGSPVQGSPVQGSPVQGSPVQGSPVQGSPVQGSPVQGSPVQGSPVQGSPVQGSPVQGLRVEPLKERRGPEPAAREPCAEPGRRAHLRHQVRREVVARDGQRCTFTSADGRRCAARAFLQFHHEEAWAMGGPDTAQNLKLMCRAHNRLLAERELGASRVAEAIEAKRANDAKRDG